MISTKGRYAIRLILDLAQQPDSAPVPLDAIATRQGISKKYLESIAKMLVTGRLIKGSSGKGGGYTLTRKPEEYNVYEILKLTEGTMTTVACIEPGASPCPREASCKTVAMWRKYDKMVNDFFSNITIAELLESRP